VNVNRRKKGAKARSKQAVQGSSDGQASLENALDNWNF
jgi:hypothetical protein